VALRLVRRCWLVVLVTELFSRIDIVMICLIAKFLVVESSISKHLVAYCELSPLSVANDASVLKLKHSDENDNESIPTSFANCHAGNPITYREMLQLTTFWGQREIFIN
jgi:hypothetical protein